MISVINSPHKCLSQLDGLSWLVSTRSKQEQANESAEFLLLVLNRPFFSTFFSTFQLSTASEDPSNLPRLDLKKDSLPIYRSRGNVQRERR